MMKSRSCCHLSCAVMSQQRLRRRSCAAADGQSLLSFDVMWSEESDDGLRSRCHLSCALPWPLTCQSAGSNDGVAQIPLSCQSEDSDDEVGQQGVAQPLLSCRSEGSDNGVAQPLSFELLSQRLDLAGVI